MNRKLSPSLLTPLLTAGCLFVAAHGFCGESQKLAAPDPLMSAQAKGLYTVLILHRNDGQEVMESTIQEALAGRSDVLIHSSLVNSPSLAGTFRQLNMDAETLPTPLTMVISSNNVVTGIFTRAPKAERLKESLLPEQPLAVRKTLQDGKTVLIKAQSKSTQGNAETDKAIAAYLADSSITNKVVVLQVDLDKKENSPFLKQLRIDPPNEKQSVLICLAPPLKVVNQAFRGAATKATVLKATTAACGTGCATGSS
jgi:hypothetical protein